MECAWFFSLILAKSSKLVPPYLWPYSMPIWAKTPGMVWVPMRPSVGATAPTRPDGVQFGFSLPSAPPASRPAPESFSTPKARPMSASPALTAMIADAQGGGSGGAGVGDVVDRDAGLADLLLQLLTDAGRGAHEVAGADDADVLHGHAGIAERAEHGLGRQVDGSLSGCLPNFVMWIPRIQTSSLMADPFALIQRADQAGSNPKPTASVPASSVPSE